MMTSRSPFVAIGLSLMFVFLLGVSSVARDRAADILSKSGVRGGVVVHLGCGDGKLTAALRAEDGYVVHGLDTDEDNVKQAREHIRSLGLYGPVSADHWSGRTLPYVDNFVNLVVSDAGDVPRDEVLRVLAPRGVALISGVRGQEAGVRGQEAGVRGQETEIDGSVWMMISKPWPNDIDEWTHWLHGADGNAVADDRVVGPPRHVQWVAPPRWQRHHEATPSLSAMVSSGGRLFAIINEAAAGVDGMPDRWALIARDAFNGKLLWKRPFDEWGWSQWSDHSYGNGRWNHPTHVARRLVAIGDRVFVTLGFNAPLTALDATTGRTVTTYPQTQCTDEILYHEGTLFLSVNTATQGPGRLKAAAPVRKDVVAVDAQTGSTLWRTDDFVGIASKADAIERVTHLSMALGGGKVFCIEEDAVVALDMKNGERLWRLDRPDRQRPVTYGSYYFTNLCSTVYHDGIVLFNEPDAGLKRQPWNGPAKSKLIGISAETGKVLWTHDCGMWGHYSQADVFIVDNLAWVHDGQSFSMKGLDPQTGEVKRTLSTQGALDQGHHHRCYRNKATVRYMITGRRGVEFIDVHSEQNLRHHWTRGTCRYGVLPCNGLLYAPPHPCICYVTAKLNGFWALAPQRRAESGERRTEGGESSAQQRLQKGPAYGEIRNRKSEVGIADAETSQNDIPHSDFRIPHSSDWPTYRHDAARSGCAGTAVNVGLQPVWNTKIGGRLSSSVIADGTLFVASPDRHTVWAVGAEDGQQLWSFVAGGRIDTPPTVHGQSVLFGSADGWVYCLRAADGELVWRFCAAPDDRRIVDNDQLESPWPVHGSVLVQNNVAYFTAGRSSFLDGGIFVFAVDPGTGELLRQNRIDSRNAETGDMVECKLPYDMPSDAPGALPDILVGDGSKVYMRHLEFDPDDLTCQNAAATERDQKKTRGHAAIGTHLMSVAGLLDDNWFNQTYWTVDGQSHSKLLVVDANTAYGVKPFPGNARHSRAIFRPGSKGYTLFANDRPNHRSRWSIQVPVRIQAMVVAGETLFVAGTPDVVDPDDPWAAMDGRKGGLLWAVSTTDGKRLAEYKLDSPPVFDGMAAANGRLYISTKDGSVVCFGGE